MGVDKFERMIMKELKTVTGIKTLTEKNLREWRTSECKPEGEEKQLKLESLGVWVCYTEK